MHTALIDTITDAIMNALVLSAGPVIADSPNQLLPWWATANPSDLYVHSSHITDGNDVFHAVAMGLTVRLHTKDNLFVAYNPEQMKVTDILTKEGIRQSSEEMEPKGWRMLHFLCDEAQKTQRTSAERLARLCKLMSERAVVEIFDILFYKIARSTKRKLDGHFKLDYFIRRRWRDNEEAFKRLVTPLLLNGLLVSEEVDTDFVGAMLQKVRHGEFEGTGKLCNYRKSAHRTPYQNEEKKGWRSGFSDTRQCMGTVSHSRPEAARDNMEPY
jgi:hypothetical protein